MIKKNPRSLRISAVALAGLLLAGTQFTAAQETPQFRKWSGNGLKLEIAPLGLDNVRAFFIARGFDPADADFVAKTGCIYRSAIGNSGTKVDDPMVTVQLAKWQVINKGKSNAPMTREKWADVWAKRGVEGSPTIAFHWSLFPSEQQYKPTDYNWGLISIGLPLGAKFDLRLSWTRAGVEQTQLLKNLECKK